MSNPNITIHDATRTPTVIPARAITKGTAFRGIVALDGDNGESWSPSTFSAADWGCMVHGYEPVALDITVRPL